MILIAPNAFKGSLDAFEVCEIISSTLSDCGQSIRCLPMGDGGDGTAAILAGYLNASPIEIETCDALGRPNYSSYYACNETAIIELAAVCGIKQLKPEEYDIWNANTAGLGMAICKAVENGARKILLCVGGSASIDGGTGALSEMGLTIVKSEDKHHNYIINIEDIDTYNLNHRFKGIDFTILCDVDNILCGDSGAAKVFAPQKGASLTEVNLLDKRLQFWAELLSSKTGITVKHLRHGGAAGGIAAAFYALLNARLISGSEYCISLSPFNQLLPEAQLVITGEGRIDEQSLFGKIPGVIAQKCRQNRIKVIAVGGSAAPHITAFDRLFVTVDYAGTTEESMKHPEYYLKLLCQDIKKNLLFL